MDNEKNWGVKIVLFRELHGAEFTIDSEYAKKSIELTEEEARKIFDKLKKGNKI